MHTLKQDAIHLLFAAIARHILQMRSTNCRNDNRVLEIVNENGKNIQESKKTRIIFTNLVTIL